MSFLDDFPLDFTRPEVTQLRDLFVLTYRRRDQAEELADLAGIVPGTFPERPDMRSTWHQLLIVMSQQAKLRTLVEKASQDPTTASFNDRFKEMLSDEQPAVSSITQKEGTGDWWKGADKHQQVAKKIFHQRQIEKRSRLLDINIARKVVELAKSVAKLSLRFDGAKAHGTGFLIQQDTILTNHHNVLHEQYGAVQTIYIEFDYVNGFGDGGIVRQGIIGSIIKNQEHDWAIIKMNNPVDRQPFTLGTNYSVNNEDTVIIIQHPLGSFKQFAIDPLSIQYKDDKIIQYLADTQDGSSGSPVFNIAMDLIAIHHAEASITLEIDGNTETIWRNEGVFIDRVMEGLEANGIPFLKKQ